MSSLSAEHDDLDFHDVEAPDGAGSRAGAVVGFDLDLTLIDSRPGILAAYRATAEVLDFVLDADRVERRLGITLEHELSHWVPAAEIDETARVFRDIYAGTLTEGTSLLPGAVEAFEFIRANGGGVLVVTAKSDDGARRCLDHVGLEPDVLLTHRHGLDKATALLEHEATAYVGDTPPDMEAAVAAGVLGVGVTTGSHSADDLLAAGAAVTIGSLTELDRVI